MAAPLDRKAFPIGARVEHWFAGKGTVLKGGFHTAKDNLYVQWDKGGRGLAYKSQCRVISNG